MVRELMPNKFVVKNKKEVINHIITVIDEAIGDGLRQGSEYLRSTVPVKTGRLQASIRITDDGIEAVYYGIYAAHDQIEEASEIVRRVIIEESDD